MGVLKSAHRQNRAPARHRGDGLYEAEFNFPGEGRYIHSIDVDVFGHMVGWYSEFPAAEDTYVRIDQRTGVATEFPDTGIRTPRNGLSFGEFNLLWNIDGTAGIAYLLNPFDGTELDSILFPPRAAAIGDFNPENNHYYGLDFDDSPPKTFIVVIDLDPVNGTGTVTELGPTIDDLHTITFIP